MDEKPSATTSAIVAPLASPAYRTAMNVGAAATLAGAGRVIKRAAISHALAMRTRCAEDLGYSTFSKLRKAKKLFPLPRLPLPLILHLKMHLKLPLRPLSCLALLPINSV